MSRAYCPINEMHTSKTYQFTVSDSSDCLRKLQVAPGMGKKGTKAHGCELADITKINFPYSFCFVDVLNPDLFNLTA